MCIHSYRSPALPPQVVAKVNGAPDRKRSARPPSPPLSSPTHNALLQHPWYVHQSSSLTLMNTCKWVEGGVARERERKRERERENS